jgi:hypothetical protein
LKKPNSFHHPDRIIADTKTLNPHTCAILLKLFNDIFNLIFYPAIPMFISG